jgi:leucine-zipper of insertion element IS481
MAPGRELIAFWRSTAGSRCAPASWAGSPAFGGSRSRARASISTREGRPARWSPAKDALLFQAAKVAVGKTRFAKPPNDRHAKPPPFRGTGEARRRAMSSQDFVHPVLAGEAGVADFRDSQGDRMNVHKNARLTAHSRAELVRRVLAGRSQDRQKMGRSVQGRRAGGLG